MTKADILRMAREAGADYSQLSDDYCVAVDLPMGTIGTTSVSFRNLERFAALVAAHKTEVITAEAYRCGYKDGMEAAAVICENVAGKYQSEHNASSENIADECAAAIRAGGTI